MPKITAKGPSYADEIRADEPIVVDEHGDDAAAVADAPAAPRRTSRSIRG